MPALELVRFARNHRHESELAADLDIGLTQFGRLREAAAHKLAAQLALHELPNNAPIRGARCQHGATTCEHPPQRQGREEKRFTSRVARAKCYAIVVKHRVGDL